MRRPTLMDGVFALAVVNLLFVGAILGEWATLAPGSPAAQWDQYLCYALPAVWVALAAGLARTAPGPVRLGVAFVVAGSLFLTAPRFEATLHRLAAPVRLPDVTGGWWGRRFAEPYTDRVLFALAALVPAAADWWQRRRDRLALEAD